MTALLATVMARVAPGLKYGIWDAAVDAAFERFGFTSPLHQAAAMGQFLLEAGPEFGSTIENLNYSAAELMKVFPSHFPDLASTGGYVGNPMAIANLVYANREGNGDIATGDGWRWRGRGLIDVTFRDTYAQLASDLGMQLDDMPDYCQLPAGAAMSGVWFLWKNGCRELAAAWEISEITRRVAGPGMGFAAERMTYSNCIREALEYAAEGP